MKEIDYEIIIPNNRNSAEVVVVGDVHRGNEEFDEELWKQYYEGDSIHKGIKTDKTKHVICVGDLMETAMKDSLGEQEQVEWIEDQYLWNKQWLSEIYKDCRLIALIEGNHERRARKNWFRTTRLLAKEIGVPYYQGIMVVNITLRKGDKKRNYRLCFDHGTGAARTEGGRINMVKRLMAIVRDCDAYICGHLHDKFIIKRPIFEKGKQVKEVIIGMTGAYLGYGGYAEDKLYPLPARGSLKLKLHFDIDRISGR